LALTLGPEFIKSVSKRSGNESISKIFVGMNTVLIESRNRDHGLIELIRRSFMKGFIVFALCLLSLGAQASEDLIAQDVVAIKTHSGKTINNLSLQESTKVLESLEADENIELRDEIIYPEEVSELVVAKLTKTKLTGKKPNPNDYN
jgi:hypothetical protein